ncbi:hypothetical protein [Olleya sp. HaHaR_3_96]|uniref:hypothetical protein n=1 Tax=Olleya sp. HaHaR_3_96 TaxID=2745560 RepID=UPI001C4F81B4|nr:hypothetical protein [Olleya sp. HaHaR_3_96]QXP59977.1 hypothetical protein H0I26_19060 [Olleya sp. HaHaR_3_96]
MKKIVISLTIFLVALITYSIIHYTNRENFTVYESHISQSLDGRLVLFMESGKMDDDAYCKIFLFETKVYPNLKEQGTFPSKLQKNNPKALFYIPLKFYARITTFKWHERSNTVSINQAAVNDEKALNYEINLSNFNFYEKKE